MKKSVFFVIALFMLIGAVAASEDITNDTEVLSVDETQQAIEITDDDTLEKTDDVELKSDESSTALAISSADVKGTQGKTVTLKTRVKGVSEGTDVTFTLNGKTYSAKTDVNGFASVKVKCPATKVLKTTEKTKGKTLIKTTKYSKTYTCTVTVKGVKSTMKVTSTKADLVKKYKIIKKTKVVTLKLKNGERTYKKGNYRIGTVKVKQGSILGIGVIVGNKKTDELVKFYVKEHLKKSSKWKWNSWYKVPKGKYYRATYQNVKVDKIKVKYTQVSYKKIR